MFLIPRRSCLALVCVVVTTMCLHYCEGFTPTTITAATTVCDGIVTPSCNVLAATTLDVNSMTLNAGVGNTARFETTNMGFSDSITIQCAAAATWTHGANLLVRIINGRTTATTVPRFLTLSGPLSLGSSIIMEGGSYDYNTAYCAILFMVTGASILASSTISITGISIQHINGYDPSYLVQLILFSVTTLVTIDDHSTLALHDTTVRIVDGTAPAGAGAVWHTFYSEKGLVLSKYSTFSIKNTSYSMTIASQPTDKTNMLVVSSATGFQLSDHSSLIISDFSLSVFNSNFQKSVRFIAIILPYITMTDYSSVALERCNVSLHQVTIGLDMVWNFVNIGGPFPQATPSGGLVSMAGSSSFNVSNNNFLCNGVTFNQWDWNFVSIYQTLLHSGASTFTVDNNTFSVTDVSVTTSMIWSLFWLPAGMLVEQASTLTSQHTVLDISGLQGATLDSRMINLPAGTITVTTGSTVDFSDLQATLSAVTVTNVYWCSMYITTPTSTVVNVDSSSVSLTGINLSVVASVMMNNFIWQLTQIAGRTVVTNNSTLILSSCELSVHDVVVNYNNWVFMTSLFGFECSYNSTLSLCDNTFNVTNTSITGPMSLHMLYAPSQSSNIIDWSTFNVTGNQFRIANTSVALNWNLASVNFAASSSVYTFSRVLVTGNYFNYLNMFSGGGTSPVLVAAPAFTVSNHAELQITANEYVVDNFTTASAQFIMYTLQVTSLSVMDESIVNITDTTHDVKNSMMASATFPANTTLFYSTLPVIVNSTSQFIIANNQRKHNNVTYSGGFTWNIVEAWGSINVGVNSSFNILSNELNLTDATLVQDDTWQAVRASDVILTDLGALNVSNNVMGMTNVQHVSGNGDRYATLLETTADFNVGGGSVVAFDNYLPAATPPILWNITSTQPASIRTCRNVIGDTHCRMVGKGVYTCLDTTGTPLIVQAVDCDGTGTLSPTPSTSPSLPVTATSTPPPTTSATKTGRSDSRLSTNSPTTTDSIPKTASTTPSSTPTAHSDTHSSVKTLSNSKPITRSYTPTRSPLLGTQSLLVTTSLTTTITIPTPTTSFELTPTAPCNVSSIIDSLSALPLFETQTLSPNSIQEGVDQVIPIINPNNPIDPLIFNVLKAASNQQQPSGPPISALLTVVPERISVYGNGHGFAHIPLPEIRITLIENLGNVTNTSQSATMRLVMASSPDYKIDEDEYLTIYVGSASIVGTLCEPSFSNIPELIPVGRLHVKSTAQISDAPPAVAGTAIGGTVGIVGGLVLGSAGLAGEQIGLAAISMFSCADPRSRMTFGSYRLLSPFAIYESYVGVVLGNVASIVVVGIIQGIFLGVIKCLRRTRRTMERMATCRFPSMLISMCLVFHTGTAFAASQLISTSGGFEVWEIAVGAVAFGYCVILPVVLIVHPYLRIKRAYQEYELRYSTTATNNSLDANNNNDESNQSSNRASLNWPTWVLKWVMPSGAVYSSDTRQAYGGYISSYRAPATQVWWTSYPIWTACIIGLGGLIHPTSIGGCQALFIAMALVFIMFAVVVIWQRPFRSTTASILDGSSKVLLACVLFCFAGSLSPSPTSNSAAEKGVLAFGVLLMMVTILRVVHAAVSTYFDWRMERDQVSLSLVWNHIPGETKKTTRTFTTVDDDRLGGVASIRDGNIIDNDELSPGLKSEDRDEELVVEMLDDDSTQRTNIDMSSSSSSISLTNKLETPGSSPSPKPSTPSSDTLSLGSASLNSEASVDNDNHLDMPLNGSDHDDDDML